MRRPISERLAKELTAYRPYKSMRGDPGWMKSRYPGVSMDGTPFEKGDEILYWPRMPKGKNVMVGEQAEQAWKQFESEAADEEFMSGRRAADITEKEALEVLSDVKKRLGRKFKEAITDAWMNGNYRKDGLNDISHLLQRIRNTFGPSWLSKQKVASVSREAGSPEDIARILKELQDEWSGSAPTGRRIAEAISDAASFVKKDDLRKAVSRLKDARDNLVVMEDITSHMKSVVWKATLSLA